VSLTARSQWHSRRRRYWKTMQVLLASAVAVSEASEAIGGGFKLPDIRERVSGFRLS
jgi:hypothetical protein